MGHETDQGGCEVVGDDDGDDEVDRDEDGDDDGNVGGRQFCINLVHWPEAPH